MDRREAQKSRHRLIVLVLAAIAVLVSVAVAAADQQPANRTYHSQQFGWSITVPSDWVVDDRQPTDVSFKTGDPTQVLLQIHVAKVKGDNLEFLVDQVVSFRAKLFLAAGKPYTLISRTSGKLDDGTPFEEIEERIGTGVVGHARLRFFLLGHTAEAVDAKSFETVWAVISDSLDQIIGSFRPNDAPAGGS